MVMEVGWRVQGGWRVGGECSGGWVEDKVVIEGR